MAYTEKRISFLSKNNIILHGRFIIPKTSQKKIFPIVVMLTGDGPMGSKSLSWTNLPDGTYTVQTSDGATQMIGSATVTTISLPVAPP